jgi:hypothetical protein
MRAKTQERSNAPLVGGLAAAGAMTVIAIANSIRGDRKKRRHASLTTGLGVLGGCVAFAAYQFSKHRAALDSRQEDEPIMQHNFTVAVGDHVYLEDGGEEIGAVRKIERDHLVVYVEAAGDFIVRGPEVKAILYGKVVLEPAKVDPRLLEAARGAHERETD